MINTKLQSIIDTKSAIGNAIVNKGGTITSETPFFNYAAQIDGISTGTPQTIFAASDGSKWALTNAVNLVNDAGNVTHDFNYWQPANNSTSDPILNIGTVGANISGNIRLVPVNQVNISQYGNIVAQADNGAKFVGYNGYDSQTNPTPSGNVTFNRWVLNNSASGTVIFANATFGNNGTFNGPNSTFNQSSMPFSLRSTNIVRSTARAIAINNSFLYIRESSSERLLKLHLDNLANTFTFGQSFGGDVNGLVTNNSFLYIGGTRIFVQKQHESNLALSANGPSTPSSSQINAIAINNGYVFAGLSGSPHTIVKYHESNLVQVANSPTYGNGLNDLAINNGYIYAVGFNRTINQYHEGNLAFVTSVVYNSTSFVNAVAISNGFVYAGGGDGLNTVRKYHESNLVFVSETNTYGTAITSIKLDNEFIYVGGQQPTNLIKKWRQDNLAYVTATANVNTAIAELTLSNNKLYFSEASPSVAVYQTAAIEIEQLPISNITKIKE
jgi:hypothetical protein